MQLADLKRAYAELSSAQRDDFDAWARSLRQPRNTGRVRLQGGTGKRARWNGTCATLVPGSRRNGWVDVDHPSTKRMPWRQGGCAPIDVEGIDLDPSVLPTLPTELIALAIAKLPLLIRMRVLTVCKAWAACADHSSLWESIVTPQDAGHFTANRLARLIACAGGRLRQLDLGYQAGLPGWDQGSINLGGSHAAAVPQHPAYKRLSLAAPWDCLTSLCVRQYLPWLPINVVAAAVSQCTAIQDLELVLPDRISPNDLRRLCRPTLRSLRLRFSRFPRSSGSETLVTEALLPITHCPQLHTLYLCNVIEGGHHNGPLLYGAHPSLKTLKVLVPRGGLMGFEPNLPHVEHLHLKMLKTAGYDGLPPVKATFMHNLRTLHFLAHRIGPVHLGVMYESLVSCMQLSYLRIDLQNSACDVLFPGEDDMEDTESLKQKLGAVMELPDMWFCEVPHELPVIGDWNVIPGGQPQQSFIQLEACIPQMRAVRTPLLRNSEKAHLARLRQNSEALLPVFNQEQHPDLAASLQAEAQAICIDCVV